MTSNIQKANAKWLERDYNKEKKKRAEANLRNARSKVTFRNERTDITLKVK